MKAKTVKSSWFVDYLSIDKSQKIKDLLVGADDALIRRSFFLL